MPRKKKHLTELPDKEAIKKLFPKEVVKELDRVAHEHDDKQPEKDQLP